jgi:hypothetical protein
MLAVSGSARRSCGENGDGEVARVDMRPALYQIARKPRSGIARCEESSCHRRTFLYIFSALHRGGRQRDGSNVRFHGNLTGAAARTSWVATRRVRTATSTEAQTGREGE